MRRRAVFLDRDGVINRYFYNAEFGTVDSPANPDQFELLPGAGEAIALLNRMRVPVIAISNQPGIAHGKFSPPLLDAITEKMRAQLAEAGARLDGVLYCRHHPEGVVDQYRTECECRVPKTGLLQRAATERNLNLKESFLVGDSVEDILAGRAAGLTTFLISPNGTAIREEFSMRGALPDCVASNLKEAAAMITELLAGCIEITDEHLRSGPLKLFAVPTAARWPTGHLDHR
jgi:D,D-heptose 1,7-bisphosphate phosphatase